MQLAVSELLILMTLAVLFGVVELLFALAEFALARIVIFTVGAICFLASRGLLIWFATTGT